MRACSVDGCLKGATKMKYYCQMHYVRLRKRGTTDYVPPTPSDRFWPKVDKSGECWLWIAGKDRDGYGQFSIGHKKVKPHRFSYEMEYGPIPEGLLIDHQCHVKACVRPSHLRAVTQKQNLENRGDKPPRAASGVLGVRIEGARFAACVTHHKQNYYGGTFDTAEEAGEAAKQLRLALFTHNDADRKAA